MRSLLMVCALLLVASVACAATPGQVPDATLASFGLSGMQQMTDVQGSTIRGMGTYAYVSGSSTANFLGGNTASNSYSAGVTHNSGSSLAVGADVSYTGVLVNGKIVGGVLVSGTIVVGAVSGGGAIAYAK